MGLARRGVVNIWKTKSTLLSSSQHVLVAAPFSSAYERAEGSNAVGEAREDGNTVVDAAKDTTVKAREMAEAVGDTPKSTLDSAWKATKETTQQQIKDQATGKNEDEEVNWSEDRTITSEEGRDWLKDRTITSEEGRDGTESIEDLRRRAGGYDNSY